MIYTVSFCLPCPDNVCQWGIKMELGEIVVPSAALFEVNWSYYFLTCTFLWGWTSQPSRTLSIGTIHAHSNFNRDCMTVILCTAST